MKFVECTRLIKYFRHPSIDIDILNAYTPTVVAMGTTGVIHWGTRPYVRAIRMAAADAGLIGFDPADTEKKVSEYAAVIPPSMQNTNEVTPSFVPTLLTPK